MDPQRIQEANENAQKAGVDNRVQFLQQDVFQTDLSKATVVTLYLLPELNKQLRPRLLSQARYPHCVTRIRHGRMETSACRRSARSTTRRRDALPRRESD